MTMTRTARAELRIAALAGLVAGLVGAQPPAKAQDADLATPQSSVEIGIGVVSDDNLRSGRYSGLNEEGAYGLFGIDVKSRDEATGTWFKLRGSNLGLESRELRLDYERQGQWGYSLEFSQTPRHIPYIFNTTLTGIETGVQTEGGTAARDLQFSTRRDALGLGYSRQLGGGWSTTVSYRHEEKTGTRNWGHHSVRFLVDPIDYTTQQLEATVGYADKRLQLTGGYYGTDFSNALTNVVTPVGGGISPVALPPANQSHQLYLSGGYGFTPTTRGMFKLAFGRITQDQTFFTTPLGSVPQNNLDGRIDTTLMQLGVSSRPMPKLSLRANLRYEERDDRTPVFVYTTAGATATHNGRNEPRSFETTVGKVEASYMLPASFRLTGAAEHDIRKRNTSEVRSVSFRDETEETTLSAELRRSLSDTLNGALAFVTSERTGSDWYVNLRNNTTLGSNLIHPLHLADRDRDKLKLVLDWMPLEPLSIHFVGETSKDDYSGRTLGPREGEAQLVSLDAAYRFNDEWTATAWTSHTDTRAEQTSCVGSGATGAVGQTCPDTAANPLWEARLRNVGTAYGFGLRGKPTSLIEIEGELSLAKDRGEFVQFAAATAAPTIPEVNYKTTTLRLRGSYALNKVSGVRLQYVYDRIKSDDWYWTNFTYNDGTTVRLDPDEEVHFLGVGYYYRF
jgi:MtrB/PioB family decaheme-associated outer membrane protein